MPLPPGAIGSAWDLLSWLFSALVLLVILGILYWFFRQLTGRISKEKGPTEELLNEMRMLREEIRQLREELRE